MRPLVLSWRRFGLPAAALAGVIAAPLFCSGCGGSSGGAASNGNVAGLDGNTGIGSTGVSGSGFSEVPAGVPLANASLPAGTWGGNQNKDGEASPATLQVGSAGGQLTLFCGHSAEYAGPIKLDAQGRFQTQGAGHLLLDPRYPPDSGVVSFSGQAAVAVTDGKSVTSMVLTVIDPVNRVGGGTYTLVLGQGASVYTGACPGP